MPFCQQCGAEIASLDLPCWRCNFQKSPAPAPVEPAPAPIVSSDQPSASTEGPSAPQPATTATEEATTNQAAATFAVAPAQPAVAPAPSASVPVEVATIPTTPSAAPVAPAPAATVPTPVQVPASAPAQLPVQAPEKKRWPWVVAIIFTLLAALAAAALFVLPQIGGMPTIIPNTGGSGLSASPSDPVVGRWQGVATSTPENGIQLMDSLTAEKCYLDIREDGTLTSSISGDETYEGTWREEGLSDGSTCDVIEYSGVSWGAFISDDNDELGTCLVSFVVDDSDYSIFYRK